MTRNRAHFSIVGRDFTGFEHFFASQMRHDDCMKNRGTVPSGEWSGAMLTVTPGQCMRGNVTGHVSIGVSEFAL
jgi:hypothetical protein